MRVHTTKNQSFFWHQPEMKKNLLKRSDKFHHNRNLTIFFYRAHTNRNQPNFWHQPEIKKNSLKRSDKFQRNPAWLQLFSYEVLSAWCWANTAKLKKQSQVDFFLGKRKYNKI